MAGSSAWLCRRHRPLSRDCEEAEASSGSPAGPPHARVARPEWVFTHPRVVILLRRLALRLRRGVVEAGFLAEFLDLHRGLGLGQIVADLLAGLAGEGVEVGVLGAGHRLV